MQCENWPTSEVSVRYLSAGEVWAIHLEVAEQAKLFGRGFEPTCRDEGLLDSVVNQPRQTYGGVELYRGLFEKAAVLARGIICDHVFVDGNKRTGLAAAAVFLEQNGAHFDVKLHSTTKQAFPSMYHLVEAIVNDTPHPATGYEGLLVMQILDAIYKSAETGSPVQIV